jgi:hypothetical protein
MKPMSEAHFAILRRHMVEVIGIQVELASEELGKAALGIEMGRAGAGPALASCKYGTSLGRCRGG